MEKKAKLPLGMENFERIRTEDFYYVDKTGMIRDLLEKPASVTLFTRPRRFGKTLNMSMLRHFFEAGFNAYLRKMISIRDTGARKGMKENFYHGILLGLLVSTKGWLVKSNAESGEGYSDISVEVYDKDIGILIELKYAENASFDESCSEALRQIEEKNYEETLLDDGMKTIYKYGIACYKKRCRVKSS